MKAVASLVTLSLRWFALGYRQRARGAYRASRHRFTHHGLDLQFLGGAAVRGFD